MLASTGEGVPGAPASLLASATVGPGLSRPLVYPGCVGRLSYSRCAEFLMHGEATAGLFCLPYVYMTKSQTLACEDLWQYCMPGKLSASVALLRCIHTAVEGAVVSQPTPDFAVCAMDNDGIDFTNLFTKKQKLASNVNQTQRAATVVGRKRHRADDEAKINSHNEKKSKRAQGAGQREPRREGATAVPGRNLAKRAPPEERRKQRGPLPATAHASKLSGKGLAAQKPGGVLKTQLHQAAKDKVQQGNSNQGQQRQQQQQKQQRREQEGSTGRPGGRKEAATGAGRKAMPGHASGGRDSYPYEVDYNDHFETSLRAVQDVAVVLHHLCRVTGKAPSQLAVYDPFYCQGGIRRHYEALGFTNFIHRKRDFYADVVSGNLPDYDILVTNPPYSADHKERILDFCLRSGKPWALLLPNYVAVRAYYGELLQQHQEQQQQQRQPGKAAGRQGGRGGGGGWQAPFYITPHVRYGYEHPEGTGHAESPFYRCGTGYAVCGTGVG